MKTVRLKNNKVIGVWFDKDASDYENHADFQAFDEDKRVNDDKEVYPGMILDGDKYINPEPELTPEQIAEQKRKEIFTLVAGENATRTDVIFTEINAIAEVLTGIVESNPETLQNEKVAQGAELFAKINNIRNDS